MPAFDLLRELATELVDLFGEIDAKDAVIASQQATIADQEQIISAQQASIQALAETITRLSKRPATRLILLLNGKAPTDMAGVSISVDDVNATATLAWLDDHGDITTIAPTSPDGGAITVTLSSDNPNVATVDPDPDSGDPMIWKINPVAAGDFMVQASALDDAGNPAVFANGSPVAVDPVSCSIVPGPAAALTIQVNA